MQNSEIDNKKKDEYINLSNVASLVTFSLLIAITFSLVRYHFYFQILLHVPIFQFVDTTELLLMAAPSAIIWTIYLGGVNLPKFIYHQHDFTKSQKAIFSLIVLSVASIYMIASYRNDPIIRGMFRYPLYLNYYWLTGLSVVFLLFIIAMLKPPKFFSRNIFIMPVLISIWYALFEGLAHYEVITKYHRMNSQTIQTKTMGLIVTNDTLVNSGRTRDFWFYYNRKSQMTRVIKVEDIIYADFQADNK